MAAPRTQQDQDEEERRRLAAERWAKEFGPEISPQRKIVTFILFLAAFFGILAMVFGSAHY